MKLRIFILPALLTFAIPLFAKHDFNGTYTGENLSRAAFPIGGMGAGMFCLEGSGAISHMSVKHKMEFFHEPACFAAINLTEEGSTEKKVRVVEGPVPDRKILAPHQAGHGLCNPHVGSESYRTTGREPPQHL